MKTLILLLALVLPMSAHAQDSSWKAIAEYGIGEQYFNQGDYLDALDSLMESYHTMPTPVVLYDIALTHYKLDNVYAARTYLRMFMRGMNKSDPYFARADRLADKLAAAIGEDYDAQGLTFACNYDPKTRVTKSCGIANWPDDIRIRWEQFIASNMPSRKN